MTMTKLVMELQEGHRRQIYFMRYTGKPPAITLPIIFFEN